MRYYLKLDFLLTQEERAGSYLTLPQRAGWFRWNEKTLLGASYGRSRTTASWCLNRPATAGSISTTPVGSADYPETARIQALSWWAPVTFTMRSIMTGFSRHHLSRLIGRTTVQELTHS